MAKTAALSPSDYVDRLESLVVPGYTGYPGGVVAVTRYVSANKSFGGNTAAGTLYSAIDAAARPEDRATLHHAAVGRVRDGQGMPEDIVTLLTLADRYREALAKNHFLAPCFKKTDYLQALLDEAFIGIDCTGFVGGYLAAAGIDPRYIGGVPLDYASRFPPVKALTEVGPLSVLMKTDGSHVQIIDTVDEALPDADLPTHLVVTICQSSGMKDHPESTGPQCNTKVRIFAGGGAFLAVEKYRADVKANLRRDEYERSVEKPTDWGYKDWLKGQEMVKNFTGEGYGHGKIFQVHPGGDPANPVPGSYYIGTMKGLTVAAV